MKPSIPIARLDQVCLINPRLPRAHGLADDAEVGFVPMAAVDEVTGSIRQRLSRPFGEVRKGYTPFA
jgi:type I restriction enzyme S subunit